MNTGNVKFGRTSTLGTWICRRMNIFTLIQGRARVYSTGTMNDIRMGHDVWLFMETASVWTEKSRYIENLDICFFSFSIFPSSFLFVSLKLIMLSFVNKFMLI